MQFKKLGFDSTDMFNMLINGAQSGTFSAVSYTHLDVYKRQILGRTGKGNKTTGWKGSGSATFHYNTSIFREQLYRYKETGQDVYFDIQITNEDPTSSVGRQTIILKDCNVAVSDSHL